jgi:hypothetical protein
MFTCTEPKGISTLGYFLFLRKGLHLAVAYVSFVLCRNPYSTSLFFSKKTCRLTVGYDCICEKQVKFYCFKKRFVYLKGTLALWKASLYTNLHYHRTTLFWRHKAIPMTAKQIYAVKVFFHTRPPFHTYNS